MLEKITKLGAWGGLGILAGIALVIWIEPTTNGGIGLIILVTTIASTVIGSLLNTLLGLKKKTADDKK